MLSRLVHGGHIRSYDSNSRWSVEPIKWQGNQTATGWITHGIVIYHYHGRYPNKADNYTLREQGLISNFKVVHVYTRKNGC